jgi:serine/threonine protein phosphatase PrpC
LLGFDLPRPTYVVADGVGGEEYGEIASRTVVSLLRSIAGRGEEIDQEDIFYINSRIPRGFTMLVVAQEIVPNHFRIFSVGDSSALLLDSRKWEIR